MVSLTPAQRRALRARAHALKPTVIVGEAGLTPAVLAELDRTLKSHELIKVKAATGEREARDAMLLEICGALNAAPVQHIGKILVIFRENPDRPPPGPQPRKPARPASRRRKPMALRPLRKPPSRGG